MTKILLVEDNDLNRDMLSRRLKRHGYDVVTAEDGQQALDAAHRDRPDVIIMDMNLPVIDGWEATRRLKANSDTRNIPVVGLSAHAMQEDRQRALEHGCDAYEIKPVDLPKLLATVDAVSRPGKE